MEELIKPRSPDRAGTQVVIQYDLAHGCASKCGTSCPLERLNQVKTSPDSGLKACCNLLLLNDLDSFCAGTNCECPGLRFASASQCHWDRTHPFIDFLRSATFRTHNHKVQTFHTSISDGSVSLFSLRRYKSIAKNHWVTNFTIGKRFMFANNI